MSGGSEVLIITTWVTSPARGSSFSLDGHCFYNIVIEKATRLGNVGPAQSWLGPLAPEQNWYPDLKQSLIKALSWPNAAWLQCSQGSKCFQYATFSTLTFLTISNTTDRKFFPNNYQGHSCLTLDFFPSFVWCIFKEWLWQKLPKNRSSMLKCYFEQLWLTTNAKPGQTEKEKKIFMAVVTQTQSDIFSLHSWCKKHLMLVALVSETTVDHVINTIATKVG